MYCILSFNNNLYNTLYNVYNRIILYYYNYIDIKYIEFLKPNIRIKCINNSYVLYTIKIIEGIFLFRF